MTNQPPITPPPELVQQWYLEGDNQLAPYYVYVATQAAQWGADQELEACVKLWSTNSIRWTSSQLHDARRPKLPSLKEQALRILGITLDGRIELEPEDITILTRALKALPE